MSFAKLERYLAQDKLTVEQHIDALDILSELDLKLGSKEIVVEEPEDINDEVFMVWTEDQLKALREPAVVSIANERGLDASIRDAKTDTIRKILEDQRNRG